MTLALDQAVEILQRTPDVLRALLGGLSDGWVLSNYGPDTFSPFDVVGHLVHGERTDWMVRVRVILEHGEKMTFEPFDRYAMYEVSRGKSMADLLQQFAAFSRAQYEARSDTPLLARRALEQEARFAGILNTICSPGWPA